MMIFSAAGVAWWFPARTAVLIVRSWRWYKQRGHIQEERNGENPQMMVDGLDMSKNPSCDEISRVLACP